MRGFGFSKVRKSCVRLAALVVVVSFLAAACGSGDNSGSADANAEAEAEDPQRGGTIVVSKPSDTTSYDPVDLLGIPANITDLQAFAIYDALFYQDPDTFELVPRIGTSLESSDGAKTWVLELRENVTFSDDTPFDAEAVKFNWERIADPETEAPTKGAAQEIQEMEVVDPHTLRITLGEPNPVWDQLVATDLSRIGSPTAIRSLGDDFGSQPVGAGPFMLEEWVSDSQQTFVRNPNYYKDGRPYLDEMVVRIIPEETAAYNAFRAGEFDIAGVRSPSIIEMATEDGETVHSMGTVGGGWALELNQTEPPLNDERVREAIDLAIDRDQFYQVRRSGDEAFLMEYITVEGGPYWDSTLKLPEHDLARAQQLIDEVVSETGQPLQFSIMVISNPAFQEDAVFLQSQLSELEDVEVTLDILDPSTLVPRRNSGDFEAILNLVRWNEPATDFVASFKSDGSQNFIQYSNPELDELLNAIEVETDDMTKEELVIDAYQLVLDDHAMAWYTRYANGFVKADDVQNYNTFYQNIPLLDEVWKSSR